MDCPSEENIIRMKLSGIPKIERLKFDIRNRSLVIFHFTEDTKITSCLEELNLGAKLTTTENVVDLNIEEESIKIQSKILWIVIFINFSFFVIEITTGIFSKSMGLVADSLDMLADAFVYSLSLWAVGSTDKRKKHVTRLSGFFQLSLALIGIIEVMRRFIGLEVMPNYRIMIIISIFALIANAFCLYLLQSLKNEEIHMKASLIFTSNDIIINIGVIFAGVLVLLTQSKYPDLIVGSVVFLIVVKGAFRILKLTW